MAQMSHWLRQFASVNQCRIQAQLPDAQSPWNWISFIDASAFKLDAIIVFIRSFGWLHVPELHGKNFLRAKHRLLSITSRKLHGKLRLVQI